MKRPLTARQQQVARLIALGYTAKEIPDVLGMSKSTLVKHRDVINYTLGVNSPIAFARTAIKAGVLTVEEFLSSTVGEGMERQSPPPGYHAR